MYVSLLHVPRCSTLQQSIYIYVPHVQGRVQVVFDLQTPFHLSGVVTQARWNHALRPTRSRSHMPRRLHAAFLRGRMAAACDCCFPDRNQQGDATLGKWTESFAVQATLGAHYSPAFVRHVRVARPTCAERGRAQRSRRQSVALRRRGGKRA